MQSDDIAPHDDFAKQRADAEAKAAAFHISIDQLVSRYQELIEIVGENEPSREVLMHVATAVQTLKQSLPVSRMGFTSENEDSDDAHSQHSGNATAGAASPHELAGDAHPSCSAEQARHRVSAETRHASAAEDHGSAKPQMDAPGSSTSILGLMRSTFLRHARISSPPPDRSCSPTRFKTDGTSIGPTSRVKKKHSRKPDRTDAAYTVYKSDPFYQNSSVTLPIQPTECIPAGTDYPPPPPLHSKGIADTPFTGDMRSYPRWRDAFNRLVHAPGRYMQDCERLLYLQQCLDGPPRDLVGRYPINDLGYQFATAQLEGTCFDPQQVRLFLRHDLQAVQPPTNTYADLLRFQQDIVHICGNFFQAGEDVIENDWCFDCVMAKLPYSVRLVLFQRSIDKGESSPGTLVDLLEELQRILKIMRKASLYGSGPEEPTGSCSNEDRRLAIDCPTDCSAERDGDAFVGAIQHDTPKSLQPCAFCGARG